MIKMKKSIIGILALAGCVSVVSCSDKKEVQEDMTVAKQQSLIERSVVDFTNMVPARDFEELRGFADEFIRFERQAPRLMWMEAFGLS